MGPFFHGRFFDGGFFAELETPGGGTSKKRRKRKKLEKPIEWGEPFVPAEPEVIAAIDPDDDNEDDAILIALARVLH